MSGCQITEVRHASITYLEVLYFPLWHSFLDSSCWQAGELRTTSSAKSKPASGVIRATDLTAGLHSVRMSSPSNGGGWGITARKAATA